jgi:hypothetical protein
MRKGLKAPLETRAWSRVARLCRGVALLALRRERLAGVRRKVGAGARMAVAGRVLSLLLT